MATKSYNEEFNPFSDEFQEGGDEQLDFIDTRVVLDRPSTSAEFNMTEFPIYGEGLSFRRMMEQTMETSTTVQPSGDIPANSLEPIVVQSQPRRADESSNGRRHLPVYTVGWATTSTPQILANSGLDFLTGVHEVLLQQTVTNLNNPNHAAKRYIIKVPNGETLYSAAENSRELDRTCCGSQRGFQMSVLDPTQQEAANFVRTVGCVCGCFPCFLQELRVYTPGLFLGKVKQDFSVSSISFTIKDASGMEVYRIFGPDSAAWNVPLDAKFTVAGGSGGGRLGVITRRWNNGLGDYDLQIPFPAPGTQNEQKILLIAAAVLIEYMFFEHRKTSAIRLC